MLIHLLRLHLTVAGPDAASGWLAGLTDPIVARALQAMHARPAHAWTVAQLAEVAAVSPSTLAARFKHAVGQGPLDYLTGWRIELAAERLRRDDETVAMIAFKVGYGSESALSNAFKRITGASPRDYRRGSSVMTWESSNVHSLLRNRDPSTSRPLVDRPSRQLLDADTAVLVRRVTRIGSRDAGTATGGPA